MAKNKNKDSTDSDKSRLDSGKADDPVTTDSTTDKETAEGSSEDVNDLIEKVTRERDEYLNHLKRERASFLNHKKWVDKERKTWEFSAVRSFVQKLLPFIDDLDRAQKAAATATDVESLREGLELIHKSFTEGLKTGGAEEIHAVGEPFDPKIHEAILQVEDPGHPAGTVLETTHRGFQISGRLIRAAKVVVSKAPQAPSKPQSSDQSIASQEASAGDEKESKS